MFARFPRGAATGERIDAAGVLRHPWVRAGHGQGNFRGAFPCPAWSEADVEGILAGVGWGGAPLAAPAEGGGSDDPANWVLALSQTLHPGQAPPEPPEPPAGEEAGSDDDNSI